MIWFDEIFDEFVKLFILSGNSRGNIINNEYIIIKEKGNIENGIVGDLKIKVKLEFSNNYTRSGLDLIYNKLLSYYYLKIIRKI